MPKELLQFTAKVRVQNSPRTAVAKSNMLCLVSKSSICKFGAENGSYSKFVAPLPTSVGTQPFFFFFFFFNHF